MSTSRQTSCLLGVAALAQPAAQLREHAPYADVAPAQADEQMVEHIGRFTDDALIALGFERAGELSAFFAYFGTDGPRPTVEEALRVTRLSGRRFARFEHRLERAENRGRRPLD